MRVAVFLIPLLAGCTIDGGHVAAEDINVQVTCKDFRDGEEFTFVGKNVSEVRQGIGADSSITLIDNSGKKRTYPLNPDYLKCRRL